jgi:hypothetical protein
MEDRGGCAAARAESNRGTQSADVVPMSVDQREQTGEADRLPRKRLPKWLKRTGAVVAIALIIIGWLMGIQPICVVGGLLIVVILVPLFGRWCKERLGTRTRAVVERLGLFIVCGVIIPMFPFGWRLGELSHKNELSLAALFSENEQFVVGGVVALAAVGEVIAATFSM